MTNNLLDYYKLLWQLKTEMLEGKIQPDRYVQEIWTYYCFSGDITNDQKKYLDDFVLKYNL